VAFDDALAQMQPGAELLVAGENPSSVTMMRPWWRLTAERS
jgi:TusA-related sulfurtransferase